MEFVYTKAAFKELEALERSAQKLVVQKVEEIANLPNPRSAGKALKGTLKTYWRYRAGDYRLICDICDEKCIVLCVKIAHRKEAYR